jgi:hypothetical protein
VVGIQALGKKGLWAFTGGGSTSRVREAIRGYCRNLRLASFPIQVLKHHIPHCIAVRQERRGNIEKITQASVYQVAAISLKRFKMFQRWMIELTTAGSPRQSSSRPVSQSPIMVDAGRSTNKLVQRLVRLLEVACIFRDARRLVAFRAPTPDRKYFLSTLRTQLFYMHSR